MIRTENLPHCIREAKKSRGRNWFLESLLAVAVTIVSSMPVSIIYTGYLLATAMPMITEMIASGKGFYEMYSAMMAYLSADNSTAFLIMLFGEIFVIAGVLIFCLLIEKRTPGGIGLRARLCIPKYLLGWILGGLMMSATALLCMLSGDVSFSRVSQLRPGMILLFLAAYTIQGAAEEFVFRGQHMLGLSRRYSIALAVILSSVFFGLFHVFNTGFTLLAMINITLSGLCFALITLITDSIFAACAMHTAWNFFQGNIFGFAVSGNPICPSALNIVLKSGGSTLWTGGAFGPESGLSATIVLLSTALVLFLVFALRNVRKEASAQQ